MINFTLLKEFLRNKEISQVEVAKACDQLNPSIVSLVLTGTLNPGERLLNRIEKGLRRIGFSEEEVRRISRK